MNTRMFKLFASGFFIVFALFVSHVAGKPIFPWDDDDDDDDDDYNYDDWDNGDNDWNNNDDDDEDWENIWVTPIQKTTDNPLERFNFTGTSEPDSDLNRFTRNPNLYFTSTPEPYLTETYPYLTWTPDIDWPWTRNDYTHPPPIEYKINYSGPTITVYIALPIALIIFILILVKIFKYKCETDDSLYESSTVSHPPPRREATTVSASRITVSTVITPTTSAAQPARLLTTLMSSSPVSDSTDQPPDYFSVVSGNWTQETKFPEVHTRKVPDTPPPQYDETPPRY